MAENTALSGSVLYPLVGVLLAADLFGMSWLAWNLSRLRRQLRRWETEQRLAQQALKRLWS